MKKGFFMGGAELRELICVNYKMIISTTYQRMQNFGHSQHRCCCCDSYKSQMDCADV